MTTFKKILLATDFSDTATKAQEFAMTLRNTFDAELHIAHVFDPSTFEMPAPYYFMPGADHWLREHVDTLRKKGEHHLQEYAATMGEFHAHFLEGKPGRELVKLIEECDIDLVVMGTHGHSGLERLFVGSVAEYVMRHTKASVLTVKPS